jgi:predicted CoA-substrate-specific enzyme activase
MNVCAGVDAGSRTLKLVLLETDSKRMLAFGVIDQSIDPDTLAQRLLEQRLASSGLSRPDLRRVVATGYGRNRISFADTTVTEITCHARGVHHLLPEARTIIEIGGQDSKVVHLNEDGSVRDFNMNDRCASGTGRFLEVIAQRLEIPLQQVGDRVRQSRSPAAISSTCVVFAESETIGLLAAGVSPADILAGIQKAVATRVAALAGRHLHDPVCFTGGVALVPGMMSALATALQRPLLDVPHPQLTGALGAALIAAHSA